MAFLAKGTKKDLQQVAFELGIQETESMKVYELKNAITNVQGYDEEFVKGMLSTIMEDRKRNEELEDFRRKEESKRLEEESKRKDEESKRKDEESKRKDELRKQEIELEMQRMQLEKEKLTHNVKNDVTSEINGKPHLNLQNIIQKFDPKICDISLYLVLFERQVKRVEIKKEYWVAHLIGLLPYEIAEVIARESEEITDDYEKVKDLLLKRYKLTPEKFRQMFVRHTKRIDITWKDFAYELRNYFKEWIRGMEVTTFEELCDLMVTDQIKRKAPSEMKEHFFDEWSLFKSSEIISAKLDDYENVKNSFGRKTKENLYKENWNKPFKGPNSANNNLEGKRERVLLKTQQEQKDVRQKFSCFACGKEGHLKRSCPKLAANQGSGKANKNELERKGLNEVSVALSNARFNWEIPVGETDGELLKVDLGIGSHKFQGIIDSGAEITVLRKSVVPEEYLQSGGKIFLRPAIGNPVEAKLVSIPLCLRTEDGVIPYVQVHAAVVDGLHEEALITPKVFSWLNEQRLLYLGDEVDILQDKEAEEEQSGFSVNRRNSNDKNFEDEDNFIQGKEENKGKAVLNVEGRTPETKRKPLVLNEISDVSTTPVEITVLTEAEEKKEANKDSEVSQAQLFRKEQLACPTLRRCFEEARLKKNNYWIESGLLYHMGKVGGQKCAQLVVPACRRKEILKLAHETPFGGHFAAKKTRDRIAMSFWWEGMPKEVKQLCAACHDCQMRRKTKVNDRAPIQAVGRPELPFQVINADILGPVEPKSSRGHQYVLCVMDQHSRWPEAIPLKSLTAKATCEAFMEIFVRTGIPRMIAMDNGTNFASKLTQEFLKQLGCVPKFSTPGYPQSNGLVERWVGTMKSMLHHAINSHGRGWDKQLPFLLWAYREVPNATTGVAPFLLVYGRPPIGPLALLKSGWEDEVILPQGIGESVADYMQKLQVRIKEAVEYADSIAKNQQEKYVNYYNLRSKDTEFSVGDEVVILIPDSTNKLCSRWKGPGEIIEKKSPHSFMVKLIDGSIRHLHQNKLRKYIQPVRTIGVIYETDEEFGEIQHAPIEQRHMTDLELERNVQSCALSAKQFRELINLIKEYRTVFDGELKRANVGSHVIQLKSGIERKQPHIYRVPEILRSKVEKQITELLDKDLIEPSTAEIAYPIVCVAKKDGTIRLCVDYRELNAATKVSPFPMQNSSNLRFKAGNAKYLTTLDILKGYWEIPLEKNSRELTSFVSPKGQYQWKVMPFGLSGAPSTFQRTMNQALRPHSDYAESFLDDIIIFSSGWEDHLKHIKAVLETLKTLNFSANLNKCRFALSKVKYLGHIVGSGKHGPDPEKISAIKNLKAPKTKKGLRSILGLFNYYREYVPHYANIAKPLTDLTRKTVSNELPWTKEAETSFNLLKDSLCSITSLSTPDMSKPFEIHTDASLTGIGACLMQRDDNGNLKPITFASQKLTTAQSRWSTIEREAYAVIWALGKFEEWTYGNPVTLHTDHNPLKYLTQTVPKNARLQRWALALSRFQVVIAHKPGSANAVADALSRIYE